MVDQINGSGRVKLNAGHLSEKINNRNPEFSQRIKAAMQDVNSKQEIADQSIEKVLLGEMGIHEGMMAIGKAETSLKILAQVRNKVMSAYNEVMRMQV